MRPVAPRLLEAVDDVPVTTLLEPVERERRTRHVAQYVLEALVVTAVERDLGVDVDASDLSERVLDWPHGAHGLHELERTLTRGVAEQLQVGGGGRVTRGEHGLIMREFRWLVGEAVERATVGSEHASDARVCPRGDLLHLLEPRARCARLASLALRALRAVGVPSAWNASVPLSPRTYTPSSASGWKWTFKRSDESLRWMNVTAPTCASCTLGRLSCALARCASERDTAPVNAESTSEQSARS